MYYIGKASKVQIYINKYYKNMTTIQKELGCDIIINGGLYDMSRYTPVCWLRADGVTLHSESWSAWGFGWDVANLQMQSSVSINTFKNFITCVSLIKDRTLLKLPSIRVVHNAAILRDLQDSEINPLDREKRYE